MVSWRAHKLVDERIGPVRPQDALGTAEQVHVFNGITLELKARRCNRRRSPVLI